MARLAQLVVLLVVACLTGQAGAQSFQCGDRPGMERRSSGDQPAPHLLRRDQAQGRRLPFRAVRADLGGRGREQSSRCRTWAVFGPRAFQGRRDQVLVVLSQSLQRRADRPFRAVRRCPAAPSEPGPLELFRALGSFRCRACRRLLPGQRRRSVPYSLRRADARRRQHRVSGHKVASTPSRRVADGLRASGWRRG
jgi:hypothetical protein